MANTKEETQEDRDKRWYGAELMGTQCQCERTKKPGFALCFKCYNRLPQELQKTLYRKIGAGYEQAYEGAVKWLGENDEQGTD